MSRHNEVDDRRKHKAGWRIYGCSSDRYVVRVWGMDQKGQQINAFIPCATEKMARHAAASALVELGARAHFCIASIKR